MPENRFVSTCISLLLSLLISAASLSGQKKFSLRGELQFDPPGSVLPADYHVELACGGDHFITERALVAVNGSFQLRDASAGLCQVRVLTLHGDPVFEQYVNVIEGVELDIRVPVQRAARPASGTVDARQLAHPTPPKAIHAYVDAKKAAAAGDLDKAIARYQRAVEVDQQFLAAWNDLGVALMRKNRVNEAADAFRKAAALTPGPSSEESMVVNRNLQVALFKLKSP